MSLLYYGVDTSTKILRSTVDSSSLTYFYNALEISVHRGRVNDDVRTTRTLHNILYTDFYPQMVFGCLVPPTGEDMGRFPFDQKFRKFRVWEPMEQTFSGISFRNFGCTSRGWPKIPENQNNRKIPFHSTIPARAQFLRARKSNSTWLPILLLNISVPLVFMPQMT